MHEPNPRHDAVFEAVKAHVEPRDPETRDAAVQLRQAWDGMIAQLQDARDAIDDPKLWPTMTARSQYGSPSTCASNSTPVSMTLARRSCFSFVS